MIVANIQENSNWKTCLDIFLFFVYHEYSKKDFSSRAVSTTNVANALLAWLIFCLRMQLILAIPWYFFDATRPELPRVLVEPGRYPVETIANPLGQSDQPWIVLRGTKIGANAEYIKSMSRSTWGDFSLHLDHQHV